MLVTPFGNIRLLFDGNDIYLSRNRKAFYFFIFGIAWLGECSEEKDVQTWYAADPTITGRKVNWKKI